jgi:hypothetical protein
MENSHFKSLNELEAGLDLIRKSPKDSGELNLIVRRPRIEEREVLSVGYLNPSEGLVGDMWSHRPSSRTPDRSPHPDMQITIMNSRVISLLAQEVDRWPLAGDQLYVDLDLSSSNVSPGTQLSVGSAILEITDQPHRPCFKFADRFGKDAVDFINSPIHKELQLRGVNSKVVLRGEIKIGDFVKKSPGSRDLS